MARILRDSWVWIPCNAVMSDADYSAWSKVVLEACEKGDLDSLIGQEFTSRDNIRLVPDIEYPVSKKDEISFASVASFDWNAIPELQVRHRPVWLYVFLQHVLRKRVIFQNIGGVIVNDAP